MSDLISKINQKTDIGYRELFYRYYPTLCHYAHKILGDTEEEQDVVQESIVMLWESNLHFDNINALTTYLYKTVFSRCLNILRKNKQYNIESLDDVEENYYDNDNQTSILEEEYFRLLYKAIDEMSEQRRNITLLSMQNMTNTEIAEMLGISVNTVKTIKKQVYSILRKALPIPAITFFIDIILH